MQFKLTMSLVGILLLGLGNSSLVAYDASPRCYKNLQINFFQERLVYEAFSLHGVPQGAWPTIFHDLDDQQKHVPERIRDLAAVLRPDPLDPVFIPEVARKILLDVLFKTFSTVMRMHDLSNDADITAMFNFILSKQIGKVDSCVPEPLRIPVPVQTLPPGVPPRK